jgi:hypothetical protein
VGPHAAEICGGCQRCPPNQGVSLRHTQYRIMCVSLGGACHAALRTRASEGPVQGLLGGRQKHRCTRGAVGFCFFRFRRCAYSTTPVTPGRGPMRLRGGDFATPHATPPGASSTSFEIPLARRRRTQGAQHRGALSAGRAWWHVALVAVAVAAVAGGTSTS